LLTTLPISTALYTSFFLSTVSPIVTVQETKLNMPVQKAVSVSGEELQNLDFEKIQGGIVLIPQPLDDPGDPLNWPFRRKCIIIATLSVAMFAGYAAPFCGQLNLMQQAILYRKTVVEITYFVRKDPVSERYNF
jgi:hypothetical protein